MTIHAICDNCGEAGRCVQTDEGLMCEDCEQQYRYDRQMEEPYAYEDGDAS